MRCIHIYRGTPQLGGIKLHTHFPWFHTAKWGVYRIAPRTALLTRYTHLSGLILGELWNSGAPRFRVSPRFTGVCPDKHELTSTIDMVYKRTQSHTHTHTHTHTQFMAPYIGHYLQFLSLSYKYFWHITLNLESVVLFFNLFHSFKNTSYKKWVQSSTSSNIRLMYKISLTSIVLMITRICHKQIFQ